MNQSNRNILYLQLPQYWKDLVMDYRKDVKTRRSRRAITEQMQMKSLYGKEMRMKWQETAACANAGVNELSSTFCFATVDLRGLGRELEIIFS